MIKHNTDAIELKINSRAKHIEIDNYINKTVGDHYRHFLYKLNMYKEVVEAEDLIVYMHIAYMSSFYNNEEVQYEFQTTIIDIATATRLSIKDTESSINRLTENAIMVLKSNRINKNNSGNLLLILSTPDHYDI